MTQATISAPEDNKYYIGIDVHKRSWTVTVRYAHMELKTFVMDPSVPALNKHLRENYPAGRYFSVYEAGFCGLTAHRQLCALGIENIVVHAADVPTSDKERDRKNDPRDSRKLARELQSGNLKSIYILSEQAEQFRALCRLREKARRDSTRLKNRIRGCMHYHGFDAPEETAWSGKFIAELHEMFSGESAVDATMQFMLNQLDFLRQQHSAILRKIRKFLAANENGAKTVRLLMTIPGVGFVTAVTFLSEIVDIHRFPSLDELCSTVGLVPSTGDSGERRATRGLTKRKNGYLKHLIIEAAWIAVRKDGAMLESYQKLTRRMEASRAIIRSSSKLLNRIRSVWKNQKPYVTQAING
jgi:transposase